MSQKFIITYPGQGSQRVGMGKDLFESHRVAKEVFEEVDDSLGECLSKTHITIVKKNTPKGVFLILNQIDYSAVFALAGKENLSQQKKMKGKFRVF